MYKVICQFAILLNLVKYFFARLGLIEVLQGASFG